SRTATIPAPRHRCMLPPPRPPAVRPRRCIASKHSLLWCLQRKGHATVRLDMRAHSERLVQSRARRQVVVYRLRVVELALPERDLRVRQLERTAHPLAVLHARDLVAALRLLKRQLLRGTTITGLLHLREQRLHFVLHLIAQQALPDSRLLQGRLLLLQPGRPLESAEQRQAHLDADLPAVHPSGSRARPRSPAARRRRPRSRAWRTAPRRRIRPPAARSRNRRVHRRRSRCRAPPHRARSRARAARQPPRPSRAAGLARR